MKKELKTLREFCSHYAIVNNFAPVYDFGLLSDRQGEKVPSPKKK